MWKQGVMVFAIIVLFSCAVPTEEGQTNKVSPTILEGTWLGTCQIELINGELYFYQGTAIFTGNSVVSAIRTHEREEEVDFMWYIEEDPSKYCKNTGTVVQRLDATFTILSETETFEGKDIMKVDYLTTPRLLSTISNPNYTVGVTTAHQTHYHLVGDILYLTDGGGFGEVRNPVSKIVFEHPYTRQ